MSEPRPIDVVADELADGDFNVRARALGELVRRGHASTPALLRMLGHADLEVRIRAARGLADLVDPTAADPLAAITDDPDPRLRSYGAFGLARLRDARALDALVRTINDFPDVLRTPDTLATDGLVGLGPMVLPRMGELLSSSDGDTRLRALHVIQVVLSGGADAIDWPARWRQLGAYDPLADESVREPAAAQWRAWIAERAESAGAPGSDGAGVVP